MDLTGLLAEPSRATAFAAVTLGARTVAEVATRGGLSAKDAAVAVQRLTDGGVLVFDRRVAGLVVDFDAIKSAARTRSAAERAGDVDEDVEASLRPFVRDGRLLRLPSQLNKKKLALTHIATTSFPEGQTFDEQAVNATLQTWCDGGATDHVSIRRYLVDFGFLDRTDGVYTRALR